MLGITVFWWAITGTFAGIILTRIVEQIDAQRRFRVADGTIVSSQVESHRGSKTTQYSPVLRYRYTARNKEYVGDRYTFDSSSSSDSRLARDVVAAHPAGRAVTVYYDPDRPESAILSLAVPNGLWGQFLFVQPFLVIGLGFLYGLFSNPFAMRRLQRFLSAPPSLPWEIPGWGRMEARSSGWSIGPRPSRVLHIGGAYAMTSFLAAVVVIIAGQGFSNPPGWLILSGYGAALAGAGVLGTRMMRANHREVSFDPQEGTLTIVLRRGARKIASTSIEALLVRRQIVVVSRKGGSGTKPDDPELVALLRDKEIVPLNKFDMTWDADEVARKAGEEIARSAGVRFRAPDPQRT